MLHNQRCCPACHHPIPDQHEPEVRVYCDNCGSWVSFPRDAWMYGTRPLPPKKRRPTPQDRRN